jgi:hypothetical protein
MKVPALDVPNSTRLKLSANSTKRASWDAKLGFRRFRPYATLRSLCPDGGHIFAIDIIVLRKYPMIFRETMKDGTVVNRNEQEEEDAKSEHEVSKIFVLFIYLFIYFCMHDLINCILS